MIFCADLWDFLCWYFGQNTKEINEIRKSGYVKVFWKLKDNFVKIFEKNYIDGLANLIFISGWAFVIWDLKLLYFTINLCHKIWVAFCNMLTLIILFYNYSFCCSLRGQTSVRMDGPKVASLLRRMDCLYMNMFCILGQQASSILSTKWKKVSLSQMVFII